mgnify:CR=1 FL=1
MSWREVVVDNPSKISVSGNYLLIRGNELAKIHLSEISLLLISNNCVNITVVAMLELVKNKIKIIFCDEKHNPCGEIVGYYGCHNCAKKVLQQISWDKEFSKILHTKIIYQKISNQANLLKKLKFDDRANQLYDFAEDMQIEDLTNREGHSAKVYFNTLFGMEFTRDKHNDINSALNYGYSILLSVINREVVANGCITQLGINHCSEYNQFNFSCDLIEPFRIIVDEFVFVNQNKKFDKNYKFELVDLLNKEVRLDINTTLLNAIKRSVKSIITCLNSKDISLMLLYEHK